MLAKDPSERPESATDVLSALDAADLGTSIEQPATGVDEAHALDGLAGGVFVGRQREMGDLKAALEDALSGRGRLVTLVGEPGIGKSRTAQELTTYAGLRGSQVLWGRSYEEQGVPPYWPWVQAIRSYVRERDPEQLMSEMGSGAADIAEVVSDVRERLPGLPPAPQLEPEQARFRLFDSIAAFFKTASQRQPLVLVLDDLHWADQPSLALLQFVARELGGARLLIIGTYRDMELSRQHPLAEALGELNRERLFQRVLLRGLTQEDVGRFIEMTSGHTAPRGLAEAVHSQTEGNPLFVTEVVRLLVQEGELSAEQVRETESWTIRIPEGVREVIGRRLNRLSQRCNESLTVASVIGREFSLAQIRPLVEKVTEDRLLEVLEEALSARVVEELPHSVGRFQFTHALIQETLSGELSTTRKVRLHARIAEALEELYGDDANSHAAELAHHYSEAEAMIGSGKLVKYSLLAGERALALYASEEAVAYFQRALDAKEGQEMDAETATVLFGLGRAQGAGGNQMVPVAGVSLRRAFDYYNESGDVNRAVAVAVHPLRSVAGYSGGMGQVTVRALELVPPGSRQAGFLLSRLGQFLGREEGNIEGAYEAFGRALAIAAQEQDPNLEMQTLVESVEVDWYDLRWQGTVEKSLRIIELARQLDDLAAEVVAQHRVASILSQTGDLEGARSYGSTMLALAEKLGDRQWLTNALWRNENICRLEGDWQAARDFSDRGLEVSPMDVRLFYTRVLLEYETGAFSQGEALLERLLEIVRLSPPGPNREYASAALVIPMVSRITDELDRRFEVAISAAETIHSSPVVTPRFATLTKFGLGLLAVQRGDQAVAGEHYSSLVSQQGTMVEGSSVAADRVLGLMSQTMGNMDQATGHFEDALAFCRQAGYRPELAWTCCDYADMLRERDGEGDRTKAIALLDESLAISSELGMRPLMERVLSRREILKA